jgi:hypothetical protein
MGQQTTYRNTVEIELLPLGVPSTSLSSSMQPEKTTLTIAPHVHAKTWKDHN